jgi:hypothetical protein
MSYIITIQPQKSPNPDPSQKRTDELSYISLTVNEERNSRGRTMNQTQQAEQP